MQQRYRVSRFTSVSNIGNFVTESRFETTYTRRSCNFLSGTSAKLLNFRLSICTKRSTFMLTRTGSRRRISSLKRNPACCRWKTFLMGKQSIETTRPAHDASRVGSYPGTRPLSTQLQTNGCCGYAAMLLYGSCELTFQVLPY